MGKITIDYKLVINGVEQRGFTPINDGPIGYIEVAREWLKQGRIKSTDKVDLRITYINDYNLEELLK